MGGDYEMHQGRLPAVRDRKCPANLTLIVKAHVAALPRTPGTLQNEVVVRTLCNQGHFSPPKRQEERTATSRRDGGRTRTAGSEPALCSAANSSGRDGLPQVADAR